MPGDSVPSISFLRFIPFADKWIHFFLFLVLGLFLQYAFLKQYNVKWMRSYAGIISALTGIFYGALTELIQIIDKFDRTADVFDWIADVSGSIFALFLYKILFRIFAMISKK